MVSFLSQEDSAQTQGWGHRARSSLTLTLSWHTVFSMCNHSAQFSWHTLAPRGERRTAKCTHVTITYHQCCRLLSVTCLSLCVARIFVGSENVGPGFQLADNWGVQHVGFWTPCFVFWNCYLLQLGITYETILGLFSVSLWCNLINRPATFLPIHFLLVSYMISFCFLQLIFCC